MAKIIGGVTTTPINPDMFSGGGGGSTTVDVDENGTLIFGGSSNSGSTGADGKSAYEIAVDNGFEGTETEWLESLKGDKGEQGEQGIQGQKGDKGDIGADGYTPVKGTDYWTDADKAEIKDEFAEETGLLIDITKDTVTANLFDGELVYGYIDTNTGEDKDSYDPITVSFRSVNYTPVEGGKHLCINSTLGSPFKIMQYDEDKNPITELLSFSHSSNKWQVEEGITLESNAKYVRIAKYSTVEDLSSVQINVFYVEDIELFFGGEGDEFVYIPHLSEGIGKFVPLTKIQSPLTAKKIVYDGDSICIGTHGGGGYAKLIADKVSGTFENQAVGGGRLITAGTDKTFHSVVDNLENLPTDGDLYCFEGGINDFWTHKALGSYDYTNFDGALDETTVCGALETIFRYALNTFVGKPICFIITHKIQSTSYVENSNGDTFKDYRDAMIGICNKYSIPYYDAFTESGLNGWNTIQNNAFLTGNSSGEPDGCHPNEEGYKKYYVPQLISLFEKIMPTDEKEV